MSTPQDISALPQSIKDFINRQGLSLNPYHWQATYRYPEQAKAFTPVKTGQHFFILQDGSRITFLTQALPLSRGTVYEIRQRNGHTTTKPCKPRINLERPDPVYVLDDDPLPPGKPGVDDDSPPRYFARIRVRYPNGTDASAPYQITSGQQHCQGRLHGTLQLPLDRPGQVQYEIGTPVPDTDWQNCIDTLTQACHALQQRLDAASPVNEWPTQVQSLHLLNTQVLLPGDDRAMATELFSAGYPLKPLFGTAGEVWQSGNYAPEAFSQTFSRQCPIDPVLLPEHLAQTLGIQSQGLSVAFVSRCLLDLIYLLSNEHLLQPLIDVADHLYYRKSHDWAIEAALIALLGSNSHTRPEMSPGNRSPYFAELTQIGNALAQLARYQRQQRQQRQQDKVVRKIGPDSQWIELTVPVPTLSQRWPTVPRPNWVELDYNDTQQPFPTGTRLNYWLYDDADELLYEGNDLIPGQPKRLLLPDSVEQISYYFALPTDSKDSSGQPLNLDSLFSAFGLSVVHYYDVGPLMEADPRRSFTSVSNKGRATQLRPYHVQQLQRAIRALNLPADERGHILPNSYILLADKTTTFEQIHHEIEKQLGQGLDSDDWQLIEQQLSGLDAQQVKILDLTWLYADLLFRAAAERYDDPEVQQLTTQLTDVMQQEAELPRDPWWLRYNLWPTDKKAANALIWVTRDNLETRLDQLYQQQKDQGIIPYRHMNRELMAWTDEILFNVCTFFIPVEEWALKGGAAILALLRNKYFIGGAILGSGFYAGDAQAGKFKEPKLKIAQGAVREIAAKTLREDAITLGIENRAINAPEYLNLDGNTATVQQRLTGHPPEQALPAAPTGHHWVYSSGDSEPFVRRNPGFTGERMEYDAETQQFYVSKKHETTPGNSQIKAEFAEDRGHLWAQQQGHQPVPGFRRPLYGQHGIDGLFLNAKPPPKYLVIEIKYHKSSYGWTRDGKQMSDSWIEAKLSKQISPKLRKDILLNGYEKLGLRYRPDLDRMIAEEITW